MGKSSIHFEAAKTTSQSHNLRQREFDYVRSELSQDNYSSGDMRPHHEVIEEFKKIIKEKTGRTAQAKAKYLLEGVFLFEPHHTDAELQKVADDFAKNFNVIVKELHVHRDEGHWEDKQNKTGWKKNLHAHILIENIDRNTGKSLRWNKQDLSSIQDYFAEALSMERGKASDKKHLSALDYKIERRQEELESVLSDIQTVDFYKAEEFAENIISRGLFGVNWQETAEKRKEALIDAIRAKGRAEKKHDDIVERVKFLEKKEEIEGLPLKIKNLNAQVDNLTKNIRTIAFNPEELKKVQENFIRLDRENAQKYEKKESLNHKKSTGRKM